jgi:uncharacterized protein YbjT (DUF2867 family)
LKTVAILREDGHEVVGASSKNGVNTVTGEGLTEAMAGAEVVIDVSNAPAFDRKVVLEFFETSGHNLLAAEAVARVRHHVALTIVGTDRVSDQGYYRAKVAPREVVKDPEARYFGGRLQEKSLVPLGEARLGRFNLEEWLRRSQKRA